jgi:alpha-L-arabinofuranosidase
MYLIFILKEYIMDIDKNEEIFKGKTFQGLMKDIYENSRKKEAQINELIKQLQPMIKNMGDATILVPIIKEYMEVAVKNDEHLIKMAAIVQRGMGKGDDKTGVLLTEDEKRQLLEAVEESQDRG